MKILLTNDDGIYADGLIRLAKAAKRLGQVWVVAPDGERSAASHSVTLRHSLEVKKVEFPVSGVEAYACSGMPADCVRIGVLNIVPGKPDRIFSGINYGYNLATDLQYSATVGAAFEGAFQGISSIAFSEGADRCHEVTDRYLEEIMDELIRKPLGSNEIWNVNFPACKAEECGGILWDRSVSTDVFYADRYHETKVTDTISTFMVEGIRNYQASTGTDLQAILQHNVSVGIATNIS